MLVKATYSQPQTLNPSTLKTPTETRQIFHNEAKENIKQAK
jgi:hypothetical protein